MLTSPSPVMVCANTISLLWCLRFQLSPGTVQRDSGTTTGCVSRVQRDGVEPGRSSVHEAQSESRLGHVPPAVSHSVLCLAAVYVVAQFSLRAYDGILIVHCCQRLFLQYAQYA